MTPLLLNLLQISLLMSVCALLLHWILDTFSGSISPRIKYYIWGIVLLSLLIPFRPRFADPVVTIESSELNGKGASAGAADIATQSGQAAGDSSFWAQIDISTLIICIWAVGMIVFLAVVFIRHFRFMKTARRWGEAVDDEDILKLIGDNMLEMNINTHIEVIKSKTVSVPMMAGILHPVLFLPAYNLNDEELAYVIRHELVHYRKFDIFIKFLSILANSVHWFNPLVYLMQRWIYADCEVACDYEVTRFYEHEKKVKYAESIIGVAKHEVRYKTVFSTNFYDGKRTMKKRLESILADNKTRMVFVTIVVVALVMICIVSGSVIAISTTPAPEAKQPVVASHNKENPQNNDSKTNEHADSKAENSADSKSDKITASEAKSIALARAGSGEVTECEADSDDGVNFYDVKIISGNYEYEVEVNSDNGKITSFDKEKIDDDDDD